MAVTIKVLSRSASAATGEQNPITFDQTRVVIGRGSGSDVLIPDTSVSHRHVSVRQRGTIYMLVDEGSTNGTYVGNARLAPHAPRALKQHERIRIGHVWLDIETNFATPSTGDTQATLDLALAIVGSRLAEQGLPSQPKLIIVQGPDQGKEILLINPPRPVVLGRGEQVDLPLDTDDASRRHARVIRRGEQLLLRDLGSRNGTFFQDEPVPMNQDLVLNPGDEFMIGDDLVRFEHPSAVELKQIEILDDEKLDGPPPPPPSTPSNALEDVAPQEQPAPESDQTEEERSSPVAPTPVAVERPRARPAKRWRRGDVLVFLLALIVLGASAVGLFWLFR